MSEWVQQDGNAAAAQRGVMPVRHKWNWLERASRKRLLQRLAGLRHGCLTITDTIGTQTFGSGAADAQNLHVNLQITAPCFYKALAMNGSVGAAEAYMEGHWRCSDLVALVRLLVRNRLLLDSLEGGGAALAGAAMRLYHYLQRNTPAGSRRNITRHYDLGNEFFQLFLTPDLMYSSAVWEGVGDSLHAASARKLDLICRKLDLQPADRVMEIGTGWGGFALHAARHWGCHVTTTTISGEQYQLAQQRVREAGLEERITLLQQDYRELNGIYDKVVSIEMVEAVGAAFLDRYFMQLGRLLRPGGRALLQAITIEDHRYEQALRSVDFIQRYVFPGSFIPSVCALLSAKARTTDLALTHFEDFSDSYARTTRAWRERFLARLPEVRALGFDERFIRTWEFYLAYCEGGFAERAIGVGHLLMTKPLWPNSRNR